MDPGPSERSLMHGSKEGALDERLSEQCELRIEGMTCGSCVEVRSTQIRNTTAYNRFQAIEGMLREQKGIHSVKVALLAERGVIHYDPSSWTVEKLISVGAFLSPFTSNTAHISITGNIRHWL
jgi:Cu+-exporting ATPase